MTSLTSGASDFSAMTGASIETANYYIEMAGGTVEAAMTLYFEFGGAPAPSSSSSNTPSTSNGASKDENGNTTEQADPTPSFTLTAPSSQFDLPEGRSACTTIACEAAFQMTAEKECVDASTFEDLGKIVSVIADGVAEYKIINANAAAEHMSCGEVMIMSQKYGKVLEQAVMVQGSTEGSKAFEEELQQATEGAVADQAAVCAIITKPPESVVVYCHQNGTYVLFDSHPRQTLGIQGAYVCGFTSASGCAAFLRSIFPAVSGLGDGMMAQMYNSFEFTVLRRT